MTTMTTEPSTDAPAGAEFAQLGGRRLEAIVRQCVGAESSADVVVTGSELKTVPYEIGTVSTYALLRARGQALVDGEPRSWSVFVKVLQSAKVWQHLHLIPEEARDFFVRDFPWRLEIDAQRSTLRDVLPRGLRLPVLYDVLEADDLHASMWMEDVALSARPWTARTFEHAADLLGELAGRRPVGSDAVFGDPTYARDAGSALRHYADGRVRHWAGSALRDDAVWEHPAMRGALGDLDELGERGLRDQLHRAFEDMPRLFALVESLPQTHVHGDASPQNLLVPADAPDELVAIDWGFNCPLAVGFDLGQLLIGLAHAGELAVDDLRAHHEVIVPAYGDGLARAGFDATERDIFTGYVGSMMLRSGFTALPFEIFEDPDVPDSPELRETLRRRIELTRFILDLTVQVTG